jgi:hypothetical protein
MLMYIQNAITMFHVQQIVRAVNPARYDIQNVDTPGRNRRQVYTCPQPQGQNGVRSRIWVGPDTSYMPPGPEADLRQWLMDLHGQGYLSNPGLLPIMSHPQFDPRNPDNALRTGEPSRGYRYAPPSRVPPPAEIRGLGDWDWDTPFRIVNADFPRAVGQYEYRWWAPGMPIPPPPPGGPPPPPPGLPPPPPPSAADIEVDTKPVHHDNETMSDLFRNMTLAEEVSQHAE